MTLGITGGTGCGKTTLLDILRQHGAAVYDCDEIYHTLLAQDEKMRAALRERFPAAFEGETFLRKKLGEIVFSDSQALEDLNAITHTAVRQEVARQLGAKPPLAAIDAIGLFESGLNQFCDMTIAVTAPTEDRIRRLTQRDGISDAYARSRILAQHSPDWFAEHCDYVLENAGSREAFREKCIDFLSSQGIIIFA